MGGAEVEKFLSWLANSRGVSASTHKVALCALLFFYGKVLGLDLPWMDEVGGPQTQRRLPVVLTREEIAKVLSLIEGDHDDLHPRTESGRPGCSQSRGFAA